MERYIVDIEDSLTSYVFYNTVLNKVKEYLCNYSKREFYFDFTNLNKIDPLVVPNLLCIAYIIREKSQKIPCIYIPDNVSSGYLKKYLYDIKFIELATTYNLYQMPETIYNGFSNKGMDTLNRTIFFNTNDSEQNIWDRIVFYMNDFSQKYLFEYNAFNPYNNETIRNYIIDICNELVLNAKFHGRSFSFMTLQYNYQREKVYVSISDCGCGFLETVNGHKSRREFGYDINSLINSELEAIIYGIFSRVKSNSYGLFNVIVKTLKKEGTVRIHSVNTQLILTSRILKYLLEAGNGDEFLRVIEGYELSKNVRYNLEYGGVHIEMEIPLKLQEIGTER